eukprot:jgi/Psemu1/1596/gm1.1596_g
MADTKPSAINQEAPKGNDTTGSGNTNNPNNGQSAKKKTNWNKNKQSNGNLNNTTNKKKFQGGTTGLEEHIFYYGKGMRSKLITSKEALLNYIGKKYTMSEVASLKNAKLIVDGMTHPEMHTEDEFKKLLFWEKEMWKLDLKRYNETHSTVKRNLSSCYAIIWGQLTTTLKNKMKAEHYFKLIKQSKDSIKLYKLLGQVCSQISTTDHYPTSVIDTIFGIMNLSGNSMTLSDYLEHSNNQGKCLKHISFHFRCGDLEVHLLAQKAKELGQGGMKTSGYRDYELKIKEQTNDLMYTLIFLKQAGERFKECQRELNNDYTKGTDHMQKLVEDAYTLLVNYEGSEKFIQNQFKPGRGKNQNGRNNQSNKNDNGLIKLCTIQEDHQPRQAKFPLVAASAATAPGGEQHNKIQQMSKRIVCYRCDLDNHISPKCPYTTKKDGRQINDKKTLQLEQQEDNANSGITLVQSSDDFDFEDELDQDDYATAYAFIQQLLPDMCTANMTRNHMYCMNTKHVRGRLDDFWILLDNQLTVHIFCKEMFLLNVCKTTKNLELHTNARSIIIDKIDKLSGVGTIWLHREGIANILSFDLIQDIKKFSVKYPSVAGPSGTNRKAFHVKVPNQIKCTFKSDGRGLYCLDYHQYFGAGKPNHVFGDNIINTESSLTASSIKTVSCQEHHIESVEGNKTQFIKPGHPSDKTLVDMATKRIIKNSPFVPRDRTYRREDHVNTYDLLPIPQTIKEHYLSRFGHNFMQHHADLASSLQSVVKAYGMQGFTVKAILLDLQFNGLQTKLDVSNVHINFVSKDEHVPEIEHFIRVVAKENGCCPGAELSPTTIIRGIVLDHEIHFPVIFGEYAQTYEGTDNTMKERTVGAIALGPTVSSLENTLIDTKRTTKSYPCLSMPSNVSNAWHAGAVQVSHLVTTIYDTDNDEDDDDDNFLPTDTTTDIPVEDDDSALSPQILMTTAQE